MKRNGSLAVHASRLESESLESYKEIIWSVLEHHFNNYEGCSDWCPYLKCEGDDEKQSQLLYRDKGDVIDYSIYLDIREIFEYYTSDEFLSQIYHC